MKKKHFTLIELLVVIGIIAILSAILLPVLAGSAKKADMSKARSEISTLVNAIKQYESVYGVLPVPDGAGECLTSTEYQQLIYILQAEKDTTKITANNLAKNSRRQKFLDIVGNESGFYPDPWDNNYTVLLDHDYNGKIATANVPSGVNASELNYSVVVWSAGPDGKVKSGTGQDDRKHKDNRDNIYSFPTQWSKEDGHNISR